MSDTKRETETMDLVERAQAAGRAWAEREYDASVARTGPWYPSDNDALALVDHDDPEVRAELASAANSAAAKRWNELCGGALAL